MIDEDNKNTKILQKDDISAQIFRDQNNSSNIIILIIISRRNLREKNQRAHLINSFKFKYHYQRRSLATHCYPFNRISWQLFISQIHCPLSGK